MANKKFESNAVFNGEVETTKLKVTSAGGDEGGEILLGKPETNTTLAGTGVTLDIYQNRLRFFEQGGDARGYYIDITGGSAGASTNLVGTGGGGTASNSFATISVSGQDNVAADSSTDVLTLIAGTNVSITTNATNDSVTINSTGNFTSVDSIVYPDYITFDTTPETVPTAAGSMFWDSGDGILSTVLNANVTIGLGQEQVALVKNDTGVSIAKGKVVYINGAQGQRPTITLSDADTESTSSKTFGFTAEAIADEAEGYVVTFGVLRGVNTLGLTEGSALWLSSTAGGYTTTVPAEPAHSVFLGYVVKAHETAGEIFVNIQNGYELTELHGVIIEADESLTDNEVLAYDLASGLWKNQTAIEANIATRQGWTYDSGITIQSSSGSAGSLSLKSFSSTIDITDTSVNIISGVDAKTWNFQNDGDLVFPDTTVQNTAFLGMSSYSTTNLSEGTNLYFTDERGQDAVGNNLGTGLSYNDSTGAISNSGVLDLTGTTNEIVVSASTGSITIGIPDSPVLVTPNIGVATATSVNGTTIPSSKTLVVTTDIGSSVQGYSTTLAGINTLGSGTGFLKNTAGTWSYDNSTYLTTSSATSSYQPLDQDLTDIAALTANGFLKKTAGVWAMDASTYLTSESDTLSSVTGRGATTSTAITISNTTQSTTPTSGALIVSGGLGIAKDVWIDGNLHVNGTTITENTQTVATHDNLIYLNAAQDSTITNAVGDGTYVTYTADNKYTPGMDIRVTGMDPAGYDIASGDLLTVYSATSTQFVVAKTTTGTFVSGGTAHAKEEANPDLGFAGGYYNAGYAHAGLFRDASDGIFKFFDGYTPEPDEAVNIDTTHGSFALADISANDATFTGNVSGTWNGEVIADAKIANDLTISGGTVDNTIIGGTTAVAGTFTSVSGTSLAIDSRLTTTTYSGESTVTDSGSPVTASAANPDSVEYTIFISNGTNSYTSKLLVLMNGSTPITTEYGILQSSASFGASITVTGTTSVYITVSGTTTATQCRISRTVLSI